MNDAPALGLEPRGRRVGAVGDPHAHAARIPRRKLTGGLFSPDEIAAGQHHGDRLALDGGGYGVALLADRAQEFGRQAEGFK